VAEGGRWVKQTAKWITAAAISAGAFPLAWWISVLAGASADVALGVAGAVTGVVLAPMAWWAGREKVSHEGRGNDAGQVSAGIIVGPGSTVTVSGDIVASMSPDPTARPADVDVDLSALPVSLQRRIIGRDAELGQLQGLLANDQVSMVTLAGFGGIGKTALVEALLTDIAPTYGSARRVFGWHFYSQEERGSIVSNASLFWERALRFFGYRGDLPVHENEKAHELVRLLRGQRVVLVLDGIEALQNAPHVNDGTLTDSAIQGFLVSVARDGLACGGLVITTSRQAVIELGQFSSVRTMELGALSPDSGVGLLRAYGVTGADADLRRTVADYRGHPLSLTLLARILVTDYRGDILQRFGIELLGTHIQGNVNALLDYYIRTFNEQDPELIYMYFFSVVRRAMRQEELDALSSRSTAGHALRKASQARLNRAISNLENYDLIITDSGEYDTHALIRSYFSERFRRTRETEFRQVHEILFRHFYMLPGEEKPSGMESLEPLYRAIYHGCMAGRYADALQVYWTRISRERSFYSQKELGAFSTDLAAIVPFFSDGWDRPVTDGLTDEQRAWLPGLAAFLLTGLGRLTESVRPWRVAIEMSEALGDLRMACSNLRSFAELLISLGQLGQALEASERAIEISGLLGGRTRRGNFSTELDDTELRVSALVRKAWVLHLMGTAEEAGILFRRAEEDYGAPLDRVNGFYYRQFLVETASDKEVLHDVIQLGAENLRVAKARRNLGGIGYAHLIMGMGYVRLGDGAHARGHLDSAVTMLRQADRIDRLPTALIERAKYYYGNWLRFRSEELLRSCQADMEEAYEQIKLSRMPLLNIDYELLRATLLAEIGEHAAAIDIIRTRIEPDVQSTGYRLRIPAVNDLSRRLQVQQGDL
jgi:tetratricopeptide (TPR) repeat protein